MRPQAPITSIGPLIEEVQRRTAIIILREHPEWTLADLDAWSSGGDPYATSLAQITLHDLRHADTGPPVRLTRAKQLSGPAFDDIVHEVLLEAGCFVRAGYLRARVGGPRWKLQSALGRLVDTGRAKRKGSTSDTLYKGRQPDDERTR